MTSLTKYQFEFTPGIIKYPMLWFTRITLSDKEIQYCIFFKVTIKWGLLDPNRVRDIIKKSAYRGLNEGDFIIESEVSDCCKAKIKFTETSGVYVCPGIYCSRCKQLL